MSRHSTDTGLLDLIGTIYDCAIEPGHWPTALEHMAFLLQSRSATISMHSHARPVAVQATYGTPPELENSMIRHFAINPLRSAEYYLSVDEPFSALKYLGQSDLLASRWYRDAVAPFGIMDSLTVFLAKAKDRLGVASLFRTDDAPPYDDADIRLLGLLAPHIRRAVMIAEMLDARTIERDMLSATLDRLSVGVVLTDATARIVHKNEAAGRYLDSGTALRRNADFLSARVPEAANELAKAIKLATSGTTVDIPRSGIVVALPAAQGRDLAAWVLPLDSGLRKDLGATFAARAAVFIRELGDTAPFPAELFVRRYAITPAECRLLMLIVQGMTVAEAADTLGISLATAKTHLGRLFAKTETQRQSDLVRLAMSALAPTSG